MLQTLRSRFVLSHILPILVVIPLMGIVLVFLVETQVLLSNLTDEVRGEAILTAELASQNPKVFIDRQQAQIFVTRLTPFLSPRIMVIGPQGMLMASTDPTDGSQVGQALDLPYLPDALAGNIGAHVTYSEKLNNEVVDVLVPVMDADNKVAGVIRLTHKLATVVSEFQRVRVMITAVLLGGLLIGALLGWVLALDLERPLKRVTQAVSSLTNGDPLNLPPVKSPLEIGELTMAVNSLVERLNNLERSRRRLLANLVHEIGRPLGALHSAVQALTAGADEDPALRLELLNGMEEEIHILERLLDDLSRLYDQILGSLELERRPVPMSEWLQLYLSTWKEAATEKKLAWEAVIPDNLPVLEIDPDRLGQAVGNLLSNALKYTPPGGNVFVDAGVGLMNLTNETGGPRMDGMWIRVRDTGPGIPTDERELIFTPFYRGTLKRRFPQGMGLGLTIANDLINAHGGRLTLDPSIDKGSSFTIWLPLPA